MTDRANFQGLYRDGLLFLLLSLLLLWPLLPNGRPYYIPDSLSYLRGGALGIDTALSMLREWWHGVGAPSGGSPPGDELSAVSVDAVGKSGGVRSLIYSVIAYLLRFPGQSMLGLVIGQAAVVAFVVLLTQRMIAPAAGMQERVAMIVCLALLTTASWSAATALPDIFAGIAILGAIPLTLYLDRLGFVSRVALVLTLALTMTTHISNLPVGAATLATGAAFRFWTSRPRAAQLMREALWFVSPPLLALATLFAVSYVSFGDVSAVPKRYPITLARSVADGPGLRYLQENCASKHYAICEVFGTDFPTEPGEFLWDKDSVRNRATPEQMERIRAEELQIVLEAAAAYPLAQLKGSTKNFLEQLSRFGLGSITFGRAVVVDRTGGIAIAEAGENRPGLRFSLTLVIYAAFAASLVLLFAMRCRMTRFEGGAVLVVVMGLITNAAICGMLSGVADRYQARVSWTIPALAMIVLLRLWRERNQPAPTLPTQR